MKTILIIAIVVLVVLAVASLVRGIVAFLQSSRLDIDEGGERAAEMKLKQNQMMFSRIKYQALAIVAVSVLLLISR